MVIQVMALNGIQEVASSILVSSTTEITLLRFGLTSIFTPAYHFSNPGFGYGSSGYVWSHAPTIAFVGAFRCSSIRGTLSR